MGMETALTAANGRPALADAAEFAAMMEAGVAATAPRLFAIVEEYGERADFRIAAWGMASADRADIVDESGNTYLSMQRPENALLAFNRGGRVRAHIVWFNAAALTDSDDEQPA